MGARGRRYRKEGGLCRPTSETHKLFQTRRLHAFRAVYPMTRLADHTA